MSKPSAASTIRRDRLNAPKRLLTRIGRDAGLPSGQVHLTAQGSDGTILMATPAGLAIHDGVTCTVLTTADGLSSNGLRSLSADRYGRVWIGSDVGVDLLEADGTIRAPDESMQIGLVTSCLADDTGVWLASATGLYRGTYDREFLVHSVETDSGGAITLLAKGARSTPLAADTTGTMYDWDGATWQPLQYSGYRSCGVVRVITPDTGDTLLVGGSEGWCRVQRNGDLLSFVPTHQFEGAVTALARRRHEVLAAVGADLVSFEEDDSGTMVARGLVLTDSTVNHLRLDAHENLWAATQTQGLLRMSGLERFITFPSLPDVGSIFAIHERRSGALVLAGADGLLVPATSEEPASHLPLLRGRRVWDAMEVSIGESIAATDAGVLVVDSANVSTPLFSGQPLLADPSRAMIRRSDGLWVGTIKGLLLVDDDGAVTPIRDADGKSFGYVYSLSEDSDGRLWMTTLGRGVFHETDSGLEPFSVPGLRRNANAYAVDEADDGRLAVIGEACLHLGSRHARAEDWRAVPLATAAWAVCFGPGGEILIGTSDGLLILDGQNGDILRAVRPALDIESWEFTTSRALRMSSRGTLLCGLTSGLAEIDIVGLQQLADRPVPHLARLDWVGVHATQTDDRVVVPTGAWALTVTIRSDWRIDESETTIDCRLQGFDAGWLGPNPLGAFRYTSLPAGEYVLQGQMRSPIAGAGPIVDLVTLVVEPT